MKIQFILAIAALTLGAATSSIPTIAQTSSPTELTAQASGAAATAQSLISLLSSGDYAAARNLYDPANTSVTPETLRQTWSDVVALHGDLQQVGDTRTVPLENPVGGTMAIVSAQFANGRRSIYVTLNPAGQAVSFDLVQEE
ncbi:DUF3887 domain-containing protein [Microcoleus sp. FACHB-1515]|uniref:DUF3887 domain-containing protein n=1 Tax=Cyanophyceae TaxID=3028117 RepID=UPI00168407E4|nr:DUF3887 domain-containing protein [Microcoleus sp. FACHB-1515]MBD2092975.1 DUF3887 domain-containing protein [Microcoleus sp. FACHB-1515]